MQGSDVWDAQTELWSTGNWYIIHQRFQVGKSPVTVKTTLL